MRHVILATAVATVLAGPAAAQSTSPVALPTATAVISGPGGQALGTLTLQQYPQGVVVHGELSGLTPGWHGIHIHTNGTCAPDFAAAGGHFNPAGGQHGLHGTPMHAGELPNFRADDKGHAGFEAINHMVTLGDGANSLFKPGGTTIIIHAGPDDYASQPAGNSGDRVGCGVITKS